MTESLVKSGQHLAWALAGGPRIGWVPYFLLWLGLVAGAMAGALMFPLFGLGALWIAVGFGLVLLAVALVQGPLPAA